MKKPACALLAFVLLALAGCGSENLETILILPPFGDQGSFIMTVRGTSTQLTALGVYSNTNTIDITNHVTWTSSAPNVLSVNSGGVITTTSQCTSPGTLVTITATKGKTSQFINILAECTS